MSISTIQIKIIVFLVLCLLYLCCSIHSYALYSPHCCAMNWPHDPIAIIAEFNATLAFNFISTAFFSSTILIDFWKKSIR